MRGSFRGALRPGIIGRRAPSEPSLANTVHLTAQEGVRNGKWK